MSYVNLGGERGSSHVSRYIRCHSSSDRSLFSSRGANGSIEERLPNYSLRNMHGGEQHFLEGNGPHGLSRAASDRSERFSIRQGCRIGEAQ